jgi:hypothetical protein
VNTEQSPRESLGLVGLLRDDVTSGRSPLACGLDSSSQAEPDRMGIEAAVRAHDEMRSPKAFNLLEFLRGPKRKFHEVQL